MKTISVIGYSGTGKTFLIVKAIILLKQQLNYNCSVIKNIHEHRIDTQGKDSYKFTDAGAQYSISRNKFNENIIFIKNDIEIYKIIEWIDEGPLKTDILFIEGFRTLSFPTILCVNDLSEIKPQLTNQVKMISGLITTKTNEPQEEKGIPIININKDFNKFLNIFKIL
ncbi:MAG: molybdopterin-guanine dinucleotide biosynthesis protein B [Candidatus Odinarchaeota archaeon]